MKSNCLAQAIKHFIQSPQTIRIKKIGKWQDIFKEFAFPHFYWESKETLEQWHFKATDNNLSLHKQLWFIGQIENMNKNNEK